MQTKKIICAQPLKLPPSIPARQAIQSDTAYLPEMWELQYSCYEYLDSLSEQDLYARHEFLMKNMRALTSPDRHVIPVESFLSSWYWYRKEHQTRCEMAKRGLEAKTAIEGLPLEFPTNHCAAIRPSSPNACNVLYRYTSAEHAKDLLTKGRLLLKPASEMAKYEGDKARQDIETTKSYYTQGKHVKIITAGGKALPVIGDVTHSRTLPDYYLYCVATDYDPILLNEFGGACVVIKDPKEFAHRLNGWMNNNLPAWTFHYLPVEYYDPYEKGRNQHIDAGLSKQIEFAYQREFRFVLLSPRGNTATGIQEVELGSLEDIAEIIS